ncbi:hypothetical protein L4174_023660 (plasmid) [Photobacterium sp. CCB-ST2H9]|uniref:hypothetical protein n=1 Tax=Photobacterium sp. CCB-ST2H9 TaxID=2912855 RepID=UPI002006C771|nr:hypothetical protein [Photobacterium sp. CCB-ST2H9]UTM60466.1 hypothetical protein L4174_023660 [Photobacterium sp. CCB-ST2H9]
MKDFIDQGCQPLNIEQLKASKGVKDALSYMIGERGLRIYYSPSTNWGKGKRPALIGSYVVRLGYDDSDPQQLLKTHGRIVKELFNCGVIEVDAELSSENSKILYFNLSVSAQEKISDLRNKILYGNRVRVQRDELEQLAEKFGLRLVYQRNTMLFKLELMSSPVGSDGMFVKHNSRDEPVTKISDLTWAEWENIFKEMKENLTK